MDPLDDMPSESRREVASAVEAALGVRPEDAEAIVRASQPLWDALEEAGGLVDSWGGGEFCYLFPENVCRPQVHRVSLRSDGKNARSCRGARDRSCADERTAIPRTGMIRP